VILGINFDLLVLILSFGEHACRSLAHFLFGLCFLGFDCDFWVSIETVLHLSVSEMAKTRGGGKVGSRRSRHNQGLEVEDITPQVAPATTLKVNKKRKAMKVATKRSKKMAARDDEVEDVTLVDDEVEDVTPQDDEVEDVTPEVVEEEKGNDKDVTVPEADQIEKAMSEDETEDSEIEGKACLTGQEEQENEEAANMEEDGVGNGQDNAIPSNTDE